MLAWITNLGWLEMLVILGVALLIFGNRLPGVARSVGRSIVEFRRGLKEGEDSPARALPTEKEAHHA